MSTLRLFETSRYSHLVHLTQAFYLSLQTGVTRVGCCTDCAHTRQAYGEHSARLFSRRTQAQTTVRWTQACLSFKLSAPRVPSSSLGRLKERANVQTVLIDLVRSTDRRLRRETPRAQKWERGGRGEGGREGEDFARESKVKKTDRQTGYPPAATEESSTRWGRKRGLPLPLFPTACTSFFFFFPPCHFLRLPLGRRHPPQEPPQHLLPLPCPCTLLRDKRHKQTHEHNTTHPPLVSKAHPPPSPSPSSPSPGPPSPGFVFFFFSFFLSLQWKEKEQDRHVQESTCLTKFEISAKTSTTFSFLHSRWVRETDSPAYHHQYK